MAIKETELATKYYNELRELKEIKPLNECYISVPLKGPELDGVDVEALKSELKMLGAFICIKKSMLNNTLGRAEERLCIALFPFDNQI